MSNYNNDSVCAHTFTPREYQVELLDRLKSNNTIVCATTSGVKAFIAVKLVQELSPHMRPQHGKRALYILDPKNIKVLARQLQLLTDLPVIVVDKPVTQDNWHEWRSSCSIFITTPEISSELLQYIKDISLLNLVIIDDGFYGDRIKYLKRLMDCYHTAQEPPKLISLVSGLLTEDFNPCHLEPEIKRLEVLLKSTVDTSSELTTQIRMGSKPKEFLIVYRHQLNGKLYLNMLRYINDVQEFFDDHRYDPSEIYTEEFLDDIRNIPDPKGVPIMLLYQFRYILEEYGCWCAYQAAMQILLLIEKMKVKVAYERHYLLLCMLSTAMMFVRATYEAFCTVESELYNILMLSTPKVYRFLDVLKQLGPPVTTPATSKGVIDTIPHPPPMPPAPEPQTHVKPKKQYKGQRRNYQPRPQPDDSICALILVENRLIAKVFHLLLTTLAANDINYSWIGVLYTSDKIADPVTEAKEAEVEHRRQEEVLRRFRAHDCNILIATSILEQGFDLPKCNLVIQMDVPKSFHSYVHCKARARASLSYYISFIPEIRLDSSLMKYAEYLEIEDILLKRCGVTEPNDAHVSYADEYCQSYMPYVTKQNEMVTLNTSIQLINRYCAKLPSDTFTKLVPNFEFKYFNGNMVKCILRLPINSPIKTSVVSPPFTNQVLAKRFAAFYMCQLLHKSNELDDFLNPITKENFRAIEDDWNDFSLEKEDEELSQENVEQRPGTTKRRQYFFKRVASALSDCLPNTETPTYFYRIVMTLTCPIPEEQNTRGRKIYPPEESSQGFGILTSREIPQICPFPIFTRSGEVNVSIELCKENVMLTQDQIHIISEFLNYTFTSVLRLQKYQMVFNPDNSDSSYFIIPTLTDEDSTEIDWKFLDLIYKSRDLLPESIPDEERASYVFNPADYKDAVVMPWYRNQDQPQYFYVAEICSSLNPGSSFPGMDYDTFEEYYLKKYAIHIQNQKQHLLDVDHTSARLNFLTPRYVNRKGVALPTSSEETKRAKRENLEQKQILVPELCAIHPFPASLWRKAVCLPCILYRVNALLLANQIRHRVAEEINLGKKSLPREFQWEPLNFGWSLLDVLKKTKAAEEKAELENLEKSCSAESTVADILDNIFEDSIKLSWEREYLKSSEEGSGIDSEGRDWLEIGTWSNDMVDNKETRDKTPKVRYGSPTSWMHSTYGYNEYDDYSDSDSYYSSDSGSSDSKCGGLHIEFQGDYLAEAVESEEPDINAMQHDLHLGECCTDDQLHTTNTEHDFQRQCERHLEKINATMVVPVFDYFTRVTPNKLSEDKTICVPHNTADYELKPISIRKEAKSVAITEVTEGFSFDKQPDLEQHPGPSPSLILQALTMSNANDGINLERLETIGDSFLKYAITDYLYSKYENTHEGKLSHLRSKQVSNLNLYRLGKRKQLGDLMIATKFDPHDNWLPPCYSVSKQLEEILSKARIQGNYLTLADYVATRHMSLDQLCLKLREEGETMDNLVSGMIPYNLVTQHSIPDKSIADCVEALIGAYLIECGPKGALLFMAWLGIRVLPVTGIKTYGELQVPDSPLLQHVENPDEKLRMLLHGYETFEEILGYTFKDRSYLLQALTHASYSPNDVTDCYQRLEFLGDAVLDYLITRHLYEDARMHSPGALTDLRSALVNNTIFASLAVKYKFHRYFRYLSPALHVVIEKFIRIQEEAGHKVSEELFLLDTEEGEEVEDVEVPKVLGDVFESVAGAIFLDSGRSLDAVWRVYYLMMRNEIELFSDKVPKSPIRELLELEPETAKFGTAEKLADGRRVRVAVEVFGKGVFKGVGRNYRIAKCTAAKCALKHLKKQSAYSKLI